MFFLPADRPSVRKNTMGLWSFWSFSLLSFVLLFPFHSKFVAQAEISSPTTENRFYRQEITPLEARVTRKSTEVKVSFKVDNSPKVLSAFETESVGLNPLNPNNGKQVGKEIHRGLGNVARIGIKTVPNYPKRLKIPGQKYGDISKDNQKRHTANMMLENTFPVTRKRAKRNVGTTYTENVDRSKSGEVQPRERFVETVQSVANSRAEFRRTGEEAKGANPRQSEPHLDTSTFALSGDSAHNQAMVHWSGHNSSVSFSFAKPHFIIS